MDPTAFVMAPSEHGGVRHALQALHSRLFLSPEQLCCRTLFPLLLAFALLFTTLALTLFRFLALTLQVQSGANEPDEESGIPTT